MRLGWHAGNLHWRVAFRGGDLVVSLDRPEADALARIRPLIDSGAVTLMGHDGRAAHHDHDA